MNHAVRAAWSPWYHSFERSFIYPAGIYPWETLWVFKNWEGQVPGMLSGNAERGWFSHLCGASHWLAEMFSPAFSEEASDEMWEKMMGDEPVCPQPQKDSFELSNILKAFITFLVCLSVLVRLHAVQCFFLTAFWDTAISARPLSVQGVHRWVRLFTQS